MITADPSVSLWLDVDPFLLAAIEEAERRFSEGGIPIGSVLVDSGAIVGRGYNCRVQTGSTILHGEMDALENAGRRFATFYGTSTLYTTLSPREASFSCLLALRSQPAFQKNAVVLRETTKGGIMTAVKCFHCFEEINPHDPGNSLRAKLKAPQREIDAEFHWQCWSEFEAEQKTPNSRAAQYKVLIRGAKVA